MKKHIKNLISAMTVFVFVAISLGATAQTPPVVTVNCPSGTLNPGDSVTVVVKLTGTTVGAWAIILDYDRDVLIYDSARTYAARPTVLAPYGSWGYNPSFTNASFTGKRCEIQLGYTAGSPGQTYSDQPLANLKFYFVGGSTTFTYTNISTGGTSAQYTFVRANPYNTVNLATTFTTGSLSGNSGTLYSIDGTPAWGTAGSWSTSPTGSPASATLIPTNAYHAEIRTGSTVTISGAAKCNNLTIDGGGALTLNTGIGLTLKGNFLIKSDATNGTGSFIDNGTTSVAGTTSAQRYTTGNWDGTWTPTTVITWHYISSPVTGGTINSFYGDLLNYWDEAGATWMPLTQPTSTPLQPKHGYGAATTSNQVITYTGGVFNTGDLQFGPTGDLLTRVSTGTYAGANLIGNPYPSAFKWGDAYLSRTNIDAGGYFWNGSTYVAHLATDVTPYVIPAEQGFFVYVSSGFANGTMNFYNTGRVHSSGAYVKSSATPNELALKVNGNSLEDLTSIRFNSLATEGYDGEYDALKMWGVTACPQIYSTIAGYSLAINALPELTAQTVIPVGLKVGLNDSYTITASGFETFPAGTEVYLEDLLLNKTQNLVTNPVYEFTASPTNPAHRFDIHFSPTTGVPDNTTDNTRIYASGNCIYVNIPADLRGQIIVYDLLGKEVKSQQIKGSSLNKISMSAPTGYYLVKVLGDKSTASGKVFIR